ncbi:hypothetical protein A3850_011645 [Lewinella sp. 4G2]|nr:hypothetical protein A3850_011645 [Lewinella sp. 4G2]
MNLESSNDTVELQSGMVTIWILGGYGVKLNNFEVHFINMRTRQVAVATVALFKIQWVKNGRKAKRMLKAKIQEGGMHQIQLHNIASVEVRRSNLFFTSLFQKPLRQDQIGLVIE